MPRGRTPGSSRANCPVSPSCAASEDGGQHDLERVLGAVPGEGVEATLLGEHETHADHERAADHLLTGLLRAVGAERLEVSPLVAQLHPDSLVDAKRRPE